jgi:hypothetical protein
VKPGAEYERFVYERMRRFFPDAQVKLNDRIVGRHSGIEREIDVSIRLVEQDQELLYIIQCKDWASRVDVNTLGAFSAVMQDVGASKGYLVCTSGFYESNHRYALSRGIELVTIEDINSSKWRVDVQIPLLYIRKWTNWRLETRIRPNAKLVELNRDRELQVQINMSTLVRVGESAPITLEQYIAQRLPSPGEGASNDLTEPALRMIIAGVWVDCSHLSVSFRTDRKYYLKYLKPDEYTQIRDHIAGNAMAIGV